MTPPPPRAAHFQLTWRCNLRCAYCGQARERSCATGGRGELTLDDWRRVAGELRSLARAAGRPPPAITLWGGEPLLFEEFDALAEGLREDGFPLGIVTNGTLLARHAATLNRCFDTVHVSLDGFGAAHDAGRGDGVFARVRDQLASLSARQGRLVFLVTLSDANVDDAADIPFNLAALAPDEIILQPLIYLSGAEADATRLAARAAMAGGDPTRAVGQRDDDTEYRGRLHRALARVSARNYPVPVRFVPHVADGAACEKPWTRVHVAADGAVGFCTDFPGVVVGDLRTATLAAIWAGESAQAFRKAVAADRLPICRHCPWRAQRGDAAGAPIESAKGLPPCVE